MINKVYNHNNTCISYFLYVCLVREKRKKVGGGGSRGILISCVSGNPEWIMGNFVQFLANS